MPTDQRDSVLHHVRRAALLSGEAGLTDGQLLGWFLEQHSEAAFEALMRRHGPMVLGVCRRALGHAQDAEDAFQATFLVLAQRASSVVPREAVANWLYGVARRTALGAKAKAARRRAKEKQVRDMPHPLIQPEAVWQDLEPVLDEELGLLPDKYRLPVLLCDLEGRPRKEVARQLRIPEGTLSSRLAAARKLLAGRLSRRGVTLSAGALAAALTGRAVACVPAALFGPTLAAATIVTAGQVPPAGLIAPEVVALVEGAKKAMFVARLKVVGALILATALLGTGAGLLARQVPRAAEAPARPKPQSTERSGPPARAASEAPLRGGGAPKDKGTRLKALLTERLAVARGFAASMEKAYKNGAGSFTQVHEANLAVLHAELDLCERDKDRLPVLEKFVAAMKQFEEVAARAHKAGLGSPSDVLKAKLARLEAEIALERAKAKAVDPTK